MNSELLPLLLILFPLVSAIQWRLSVKIDRLEAEVERLKLEVLTKR